jgi:serine/threonine-protein kinase
MDSEGRVDADASVDGLPAPGDLVAGKHVITRRLEEGGMGVLFVATHKALNQSVAIKFLRPKYARDAASRERFLREARAAAAITSEHAARIQDVDETPAGIPFIVMELLRGADLGKIVEERGRLPFRDAVGYVLEACEAIAEAHAAGVVHRDLKPSNLFLAERSDGTTIVKVLDFGISKSVLRPDDVPEGASLTAPNTLLGSPQYMSPEQVRNAKTVDLRADVWALGVILYELIAGVPPFDADSSAELFAKILSDKPAPIRKLAPDVPSGLSDVVMRCLVKDPAARTRSVGELALALRPFVHPGSEILVDKVGRALARGPDSAGRSLAPRADALGATLIAPSGRAGGPPTVAIVAALTCLALLGALVLGLTNRSPSAAASISAAPPPSSARTTGAPPEPAGLKSESESARAAPPPTAASVVADGSAPKPAVNAPTPPLSRKAGPATGTLKDINQIKLLQ